MPARFRTVALKFTWRFLICRIENSCSLPSLPHNDIEGKGKNGVTESAVLWRKGICCVSAAAMVRNIIGFVLPWETGSASFDPLTKPAEGADVTVVLTHTTVFCHIRVKPSHNLGLHRKEEILRLKFCNAHWPLIKTFHTRNFVATRSDFTLPLFFHHLTLNAKPFISSLTQLSMNADLVKHMKQVGFFPFHI